MHFCNICENKEDLYIQVPAFVIFRKGSPVGIYLWIRH